MAGQMTVWGSALYGRSRVEAELRLVFNEMTLVRTRLAESATDVLCEARVRRDARLDALVADALVDLTEQYRTQVGADPSDALSDAWELALTDAFGRALATGSP